MIKLRAWKDLGLLSITFASTIFISIETGDIALTRNLDFCSFVSFISSQAYHDHKNHFAWSGDDD